MWAMIEKLRRRSWGMVTRPECSGSLFRPPESPPADGPASDAWLDRGDRVDSRLVTTGLAA
jgi:hypothetical protein